ncbi:MAG: rod shape-determining protein MreB [Clostridia bacterium]|nr:rod shape-determining protein MreB [Clostridia bacterium]
MSEDIAIDLGTANVIIYIKGKGIVLREPSMVAVNKDTKEVIAIGNEASKMLGRTPNNIEVIKPLKDGVISNFTLTGKMLRHYINKACKSKFFPPRIMICVPSQITEVEKRAVIDVAMQSGAKRVYLIEEPVAAAIGAGIDIAKPSGNLVIDIGGGTTDIAVISMGSSVMSTSVKVAGNRFDQTLIRLLKRRYRTLIGERTAEQIKMSVGCVYPRVENIGMKVRGRSLTTGLPVEIEVGSKDVMQALLNDSLKIVDAVKNTIEKTPPELVEDISNNGIYMTGGGSLLYGMDKLIEKSTGISVIVPDDAISCVAIGTGKALNNLDLLDAKSRNGKG